MTNERWGALIGAAFGLMFVEINAGTLPSSVGLTLRALALAAFVGLIVMLVSARRQAPSDTPGFGRGYLLVVAAEVIVGTAGLVVINGPLDAPDASLPWIALVVGAHFFGLAAVWRYPFLRWLGAGIAMCGVGGIVVAILSDSAAPIAVIAGVIPGVLLLGGAYLVVLGHAAGADDRSARV